MLYLAFDILKFC